MILLYSVSMSWSGLTYQRESNMATRWSQPTCVISNHVTTVIRFFVTIVIDFIFVQWGRKSKMDFNCVAFIKLYWNRCQVFDKISIHDYWIIARAGFDTWNGENLAVIIFCSFFQMEINCVTQCRLTLHFHPTTTVNV